MPHLGDMVEPFWRLVRVSDVRANLVMLRLRLAIDMKLFEFAFRISEGAIGRWGLNTRDARQALG